MKFFLLSLVALFSTVNAHASSPDNQCFREAQVAAFQAELQQLDTDFTDMTSVSIKEVGTLLKSRLGNKNVVIVSMMFENKHGSQVEQATVDLTETHDNKCVVTKTVLEGAE